MENIGWNNTVQTYTPYTIPGKTLANRKTERPKKEVPQRGIYTRAEACIYLGCSNALLRRMVDLRLLKPKIFNSMKNRLFYFRWDLDSAMDAYLELKRAKILNKLPLCECILNNQTNKSESSSQE